MFLMALTDSQFFQNLSQDDQAKVRKLTDYT